MDRAVNWIENPILTDFGPKISKKIRLRYIWYPKVPKFEISDKIHIGIGKFWKFRIFDLKIPEVLKTLSDPIFPIVYQKFRIYNNILWFIILIAFFLVYRSHVCFIYYLLYLSVIQHTNIHIYMYTKHRSIYKTVFLAYMFVWILQKFICVVIISKHTL